MVIEPSVIGDDRGFFMETYNSRDYQNGGIYAEFVQDNQSLSRQGVLRGLHMQRNNPQGKLVRVLSGSVYDVAVDARIGSATYGKWHGELLTGENRHQFYIPEGFLHGFVVLSESAEFVYKCTRYYDPTDECGVIWNDSDIGIDWHIPEDFVITLSEKDRNNGSFAKLWE